MSKKSKYHELLDDPDATAPVSNGNRFEPLVTTEELASHLRCTTRTIASYRARKLVPFIRITPLRILYRISAVEDALSKSRLTCQHLALTQRLPQLATLPVIIGHGKKADVVWTDEQFRDLCFHMLNGNPDNFFLMPFRDAKTGLAKFTKAHKARARQRIQSGRGYRSRNRWPESQRRILPSQRTRQIPRQ